MDEDENKMNDYKVINLIGRGGFGKVYLIERIEDKTFFALKTTRLTELDNYRHTRAMSELLMLVRNKSDYLVKCKDVFIFKKRLCVTTDYVDGGDLATYMENRPDLDMDFIIGTFLKVCAGVRAMHANDLIHRDIKPANILVGDNGIVKVCDFGICKHIDHYESTSTIVGTPCYMSPEQVLGDACDGATDVWGIGCVLYNMLYRKNPFSGKRLHELQNGILNRDPFKDKYSILGNPIYDSAKRMLRKNKHSRPTLRALMTEPSIIRLCAKHHIHTKVPLFEEAPNINVPYSLKDWRSVIRQIQPMIQCLSKPTVNKLPQITNQTDSNQLKQNHIDNPSHIDKLPNVLYKQPKMTNAKHTKINAARWNGTKDLPKIRNRYAHIESKVKKHWKT